MRERERIRVKRSYLYQRFTAKCSSQLPLNISIGAVPNKIAGKKALEVFGAVRGKAFTSSSKLPLYAVRTASKYMYSSGSKKHSQ